MASQVNHKPSGVFGPKVKVPRAQSPVQKKSLTFMPKYAKLGAEFEALIPLQKFTLFVDVPKQSCFF
jgi:hypothetical protein